MASTKPSRPAVRCSPRQPRAHETVAVILEAAAQILHQRGLAGFNTNRIAERAGVGIGSLYGYFPNKQAILVALARQLLKADGQTVLNALETEDSGETDPVRRLVRILFDRHRRDAEVRRMLMGAYLGAGLAANDARQVRDQIGTIATHPRGPLARRSLTPTQLFVVTRAVLGIARALTEDDAAPPQPGQTLEDEAVRLVQAYLAATGR